MSSAKFNNGIAIPVRVSLDLMIYVEHDAENYRDLGADEIARLKSEVEEIALERVLDRDMSRTAMNTAEARTESVEWHFGAIRKDMVDVRIGRPRRRAR